MVSFRFDLARVCLFVCLFVDFVGFCCYCCCLVGFLVGLFVSFNFLLFLFQRVQH